MINADAPYGGGQKPCWSKPKAGKILARNEITRTKKEWEKEKGEVKSLPSIFARQADFCYLKSMGQSYPEQYPKTRPIN